MAYNYYGAAYPAWNPMGQQNYAMTQPQYQQYQQPYQTQQPSTPHSMIGVDGEVGAKAFQMPQGWPANVPIPLWDTNEQVIYLKSINTMGMPNPLQKLKYTIEDKEPQMNLMSGSVNQQNQEYATKTDFENLKNELKEMMRTQQSNRNNSQQNRGNQT